MVTLRPIILEAVILLCCGLGCRSNYDVYTFRLVTMGDSKPIKNASLISQRDTFDYALDLFSRMPEIEPDRTSEDGLVHARIPRDGHAYILRLWNLPRDYEPSAVLVDRDNRRYVRIIAPDLLREHHMGDIAAYRDAGVIVPVTPIIELPFRPRPSTTQAAE